MVFIDESGVHRVLTKRYGRAKSGERVIDIFDDSSKDKLTLVSAICLGRLFAEIEFKGSMDKEKFLNYSISELIPKMQHGSTLVLDNLSSHKGIEELFKSHGIDVIYLPPYTPEYNPIEMMWEKIKNYLRKNRSKNLQELKNNITKAYQTITNQDIQGCFNHCGYL